MTTRPLEEKYFEWLVSQVDVRKSESYLELFAQLHEKFFAWIVPNDDNRVGDALDLRHEFLREDWHLLQFGVSILEVIIALSRRLAFNGGGKAELWAWQLLKNLRLTKFGDPLTDRAHNQIDDILEGLIWRTYHSNGQGGFFPLKHPDKDQTKVEIWYQMSAYILEHL